MSTPAEHRPGRDVPHLLADLAADVESITAAVSGADLDIAVPSCPGWSAADLVWHLVWVHDLFARQVGTPDEQLRPRRDRPADAALVAEFVSGAGRLLSVLTAADPATMLPTVFGARPVRFVARRMAHETAVHRWDLHHALGHDSPIDAAVASDAIDEFLDVFLHRPQADALPIDGSVHLHCTDVAGEWMVRPDGDGGLVVTAEHAKGDCALRGPAADLLLALWARRPITSVEVIGDAGVAARFVARVAR